MNQGYNVRSLMSQMIFQEFKSLFFLQRLMNMTFILTSILDLEPLNIKLL